MNPPPRPAPSHVPTLTEVIEIPEVLPPASEPVVPMAEPAAFVAEPIAAVIAAVPAVAAPIPAAVLAPAPVVPLAPETPVTPVPPTLPARTASGVDEAAMAQRVLSEVQRQIDGMLEYRLREALTPILARTSESLVRELRQELSKTMRDVVSRAVAQEVARQRSRS